MKEYKNPIAVIGAGPVGLAAAAHLTIRNIPFILFESAETVGASVLDWGHVKVFSPWKYNLDSASVKLLEGTNWKKPDIDALATGTEIVEQYLNPLSRHQLIEPFIHLNSKVISVTKKGFHKMKSKGRDKVPFEVYFENEDGEISSMECDAVIDASGTWFNPNPIDSSGIQAKGEMNLNKKIVYRIPDVKNSDIGKYANKTVAVFGAGHSAINSLLDLADLIIEFPQTKIIWVLHSENMNKIYGGKEVDALEARGALGRKIQNLVHANTLQIYNPFFMHNIYENQQKLAIKGIYNDKILVIEGVDEIIANTGARPDFSFLREIRYQADPALESVPALADLIDPNVHSCGTVRPHGEKELRQPEENFYIVGVKSYGRAPTFLMATGYEQVRSVVAYLGGDYEAAERVALNLPETGVCGVGDSGKASGSSSVEKLVESDSAYILPKNSDSDSNNLNSNTMEKNHNTPDERSTSACCGGVPSHNEDACCKLDEEKKAEGLEGCGCNTSPSSIKKSGSSCC